MTFVAVTAINMGMLRSEGGAFRGAEAKLSVFVGGLFLYLAF